MKARVTVCMATVGIAVMLSAGCVSSRKYKASQAALESMRQDSIALAQKVDNLNASVKNCEDKTVALQQSLDKATNSYASTQKSLDYYNNYLTGKTNSMTQISQELKDGLSQSGITNYDVRMVNDDVVVLLVADDASTFQKNSMTVTAKGKQAINNLANVFKNHPDVMVTIDDGDDDGTMALSTTTPADNTTADVVTDNAAASNATSVKSKTHYSSGAKKTSMAKSTKTKKSYSSEGKGATAFKSGKKSSSSMSLRTGRTNVVAKTLVQNGVPKVNVVVKKPDNTITGKRVIVIVSPNMRDLNQQPQGSVSR